MAGHSKWANIKRRKGAQDAARGKMFTKLIKEIQVAAKLGGGDLDANPRLRLAVDKAKGQSMPRNTIERAIEKATGEIGGDDYVELTYEGYGPGGVAILVACLTNNRNRSAADVKAVFNKMNASLGSPGSVAYQFQRKGQFRLSAEQIDEDTVLMAALEGGGEEVVADDGDWLVTSPFEAYDSCKQQLEGLGIEVKAELTQIPDTTISISTNEAVSLLKLLERLEDLDDVQETYTNADFDEEALTALGE
ncbi:MAG TPA: YebC/PmpR family DNA-binding transcriptional regulator [Deltaproteobacteria bacterium]|nr:YebC/PmpR family DNA-binding transcriptional regulator [Deltaproteobacteria bacterium]